MMNKYRSDRGFDPEILRAKNQIGQRITVQRSDEGSERFVESTA